MSTEAAVAPYWATWLLDYHVGSAYFFAAAFPIWRWAHRCFKLGDEHPKMTVGIAFHQAATGFVLPSFCLLMGSFGYQPLISHLGPHELGLAGMLGIIAGLRELVVPE